MSILVIGGAGYIGSHVCKALFKTGFHPITYDNLSQGHEWAVKWGPLINGDVLDTEKLVEVMEEYAPLAVCHFASLIEARESIKEPGDYYYNNVGGVISLLRAMRRAKQSRLIFSSSASVYGAPCHLPMSELHPTAPTHPYGKTKLMGEQIIDDFSRAFGISGISLRYFNAAGGDLDGEIGEAHFPETHLIPRTLLSALAMGPRLEIYGSRYATEDGTAMRDYIHVTDLAQAHVAALRYLLEDRAACHLKLNLGTGRGYSVRQIVDTVSTITGRSVPVHTEEGKLDTAALVADASQAQKILKWKPTLSDLTTIVETAYAWQLKGQGSHTMRL